jgi:hypothetical protein
MFRNKLILPVAAAACFLVPAATVFAQNAASTQTATQPTKKVKTVKFTVTNQTSGPVSLKAGDQQMTLAAGQSQQVKVQSGQQIVTTSDSSLGAAGKVITAVDDSLSGGTVNVRQ